MHTKNVLKPMRTFLLLAAASILFASLLLAPPAALAQGDAPDLTIYLRRDFGYSSGSGRIQGTFSIRAEGPAELQRVVYYIDEQVLGESSEAPFALRFSTDSYPPGIHTLSAIGYSASGKEGIGSNTIRADFLSGEQAQQETMRILVPVLGIVFGAIALGMLMTFMGARKTANLPPGTPRSYGMAGGTICPRCQRPYSRNMFSPNMLVGKLERCPFCGKWAIVRAMPIEMLRTAEEAELERARQEGKAPPEDEEETLRKELDDSRYQNM